MKDFLTGFSLAFSVGSALASAPNPGSQWKKTQLLDDFTGASGSAPSSANWILRTGTQYPGGNPQWGTGEIETYTSSANNVHQDGSGNLWIVPQKSSSGAWTSARIETHSDSFQAPAGGKMRVEARVAMPNVTSTTGAGYWPAFWMLGAAFRTNYTGWPAVGEIDIMEAVNGAANVISVLHCDVDPNGACNEPDGLGASAACSGSVCPGNFHIYEVIIDRSVSPETMKFYVDRNLAHTISQSTLGTSIWAQTVHHGFYIILNVAMGGDYPNAVAGTSTPTAATVPGAQMEIDYVAVWSTS